MAANVEIHAALLACCCQTWPILKNDILCQNKLEQTLIFWVHTLKKDTCGTDLVSKSIFSKYFKCPMAVP
jgi:hypothetical protein